MGKNNIPIIVKKRIEISKLFYPLERKLQRRLAKKLLLGFDETFQYLGEMANKLNFEQIIIEEKFIVWKFPKEPNFECMFCFIKEITNIDLLIELFEKIKKYSPIFTYAFVYQKKDGNGIFDIFRFSKLEHCNRVKYP